MIVLDVHKSLVEGFVNALTAGTKSTRPGEVVQQRTIKLGRRRPSCSRSPEFAAAAHAWAAATAKFH